MVCAPTAGVEVLPPRGGVSARRSWPPSCGRVPENGDGERGVQGTADEAAGHAGVSSAACNGGLPREPPQPQPPGDGDARPSDSQAEIRALDVMPLAFAAPRKCAVAPANGSMEDGGRMADSLNVEGQLVRDEDVVIGNGDDSVVGSRVDDGELEREEDESRKKRWSASVMNPPPKRRAVSAKRRFPPGCGSVAATGIGVRGCGVSPMLKRDDSNHETESKREEVGGATEAHNHMQESQVVNYVAPDDFADRPQNYVGHGASPILRRDNSNNETEGKREEVGGATEAHNHMQESQVVNCITPDDFADRTRNYVGHGASPVLRRDDSNHETEGKRKEVGGATGAHNHTQESQVINCVAPDDFADRPRNYVGHGASPILRQDDSNVDMEGKIEEVGGATEAHNEKIQESQVVNVIVQDGFARGQRGHDNPLNDVTDDSPRHSFSEQMNGRRLLRERKRAPLVVGNTEIRSRREGRVHDGTPRTHPRGPLNVKRKGKSAEIVKINVTLVDDAGVIDVIRSASKCGEHVATDQIEDKDGVGLNTNRVIIQALMAPDRCPWTQRKKSIASVPKSLGPRKNVKKKVATPRKELHSKVTPSTPARRKAREGGEDSSSKDDEKPLALLAHERNNKSCVNISRCPPSDEVSVHKIDERSRLSDPKDVPLVAGVVDVKTKCEGSLQEGTPRNHVRALVNVKTKGKKPDNVKVNVTLLDDRRVFEDDKTRNQISRTRRGVARSSNIKNVKKGMFAHKRDGIDKDSGNKFTKESKCGDHLQTDQIKENDNVGLVTNKMTVLALMAPDKCLWTEGKRSIVGVSQSLTCRNNNSLTVREGLCLSDISQGKESIPICVINTIDGVLPTPFKYITKVIYPPSYAKAPSIGCDCTNGCSDSSECACAVKNGGEIPFNLNSAIVYTKPLIYECGPSCRCPPTCHNRVSQHGPKVPLEIFKTGKTGWGVRSLSFIPSGSFVCEYVGEVLQETEAERTENDEYLFDIGRDDDDDDDDDDDEEKDSQSSKSEMTAEGLGYTIDAAKCGNVGRFINHSCTPNMHAQDVLWDHDDKRMPHVMLFAEKNIRPLQELTYDYNYNIGNVRKNGKVKEKKCFCGSSKCRLRLY
uniref:Histone-lysine N-methyltransferase, H3 lysine-9 specific SUVH6 n=1 Tax=Triticum urartu TaxID=4572 RepID=A0A8R7UHY1_TRIUA